MKHDIFEFSMHGMTGWDKFCRVALLLGVIGVALMDLLVWRPG